MLTRRWWYQAYVNDTNGNPVVATVSMPSKSGPGWSYPGFSVTTNSSGWMPEKQVVLDYKDQDGEMKYFGLNVTATNASYPSRNSIYDATTDESKVDDVITLDDDYPLISYGIGTADDNIRTWNTSIYVNVSVTEENEDTIKFDLYYSNGTLVNSTSYTDSTRTINWTGLAGDDYVYNVTVNDTVGKTNSTVSRSLTVIGSQSNITLNSGWNLLSLTFDNTENDTDRNISLVAGWNLIGYDGDINVSLADTTFHDGTTSYGFSDAVSNNKLKNYLSYYDSSSATASERMYKYLGPSRVDDTAFRKNNGYWLYANVSGNLTLPSVGGSSSGESYEWSKLRFRNSSGSELGIVEAGTAGWLETTLQTWNQTGIDPQGNPGYDFIVISSGTLDFGKAYFINSRQDNLTLIRQN